MGKCAHILDYKFGIQLWPGDVAEVRNHLENKLSPIILYVSRCSLDSLSVKPILNVVPCSFPAAKTPSLSGVCFRQP
jgi:hypothetical protein